MHSNHTSTTDNNEISGLTEIADVTVAANRAGGRPRLRALVGGVVAIGGLTFGIGAALAQDPAVQVGPAVADHGAIAEMARSNGLSGLSPASLASIPVSAWYGDDAAIAAWARSNGLTGLSPASVTPAAD